MEGAVHLGKNIPTCLPNYRGDCPKPELLRTNSSMAMSGDLKVGQDNKVGQIAVQGTVGTDN